MQDDLIGADEDDDEDDEGQGIGEDEEEVEVEEDDEEDERMNGMVNGEETELERYLRDVS